MAVQTLTRPMLIMAAYPGSGGGRGRERIKVSEVEICSQKFGALKKQSTKLTRTAERTTPKDLLNLGMLIEKVDKKCKEIPIQILSCDRRYSYLGQPPKVGRLWGNHR